MVVVARRCGNLGHRLNETLVSFSACPQASAWALAAHGPRQRDRIEDRVAVAHRGALPGGTRCGSGNPRPRSRQSNEGSTMR